MTVESLKTLAGEIASQLVADAMNAMLRGDVTVTVHPVTTRRALPPAKAKPTKRTYQKRQTKPTPAPVDARAARPAALDVSQKRCRKCHKLGAAIRIVGTERTVRCSCGFTWDVRAKYRTTKNVTAEPGRCVRCEHGHGEHDGDGRCLSSRCVCKEFVA